VIETKLTVHKRQIQRGILREKLTVAEPNNTFFTFHATWKFIIVF